MPTKAQLIAGEIGLQQIVNALNLGSEENVHLSGEAHARLLRIVRSWMESGPDLLKMKRHPGDPTFQDVRKSYEGWIVAESAGRARMIPVSSASADAANAYFIQLILNPRCAYLGTPCKNCGQWYIKKTLRKSLYCSRACSDKRKLADKREAAHKDKLDRARQSIGNYPARPAKWAAMNWKEWVCQTEPKITVNFLTHAVNKGELKEPR